MRHTVAPRYVSSRVHAKRAAGAIVESASLRRAAYNAAFAHFDVQVPKKGRLVWSEEYLALLQQRAGSGASMIEWWGAFRVRA